MHTCVCDVPAGGGGGGGRLSDAPPEVGTIHRGEVKRIEAYGVFVALQGFRKYGLVHASQVRLMPRLGMKHAVL